ncbi:hypothetical protein D9756_009350 [Leucocoprinus leucothites]|uniref:Transmembrane protein n=1 Tax=Leucocoprinus leucothites TaxID=201217 RepID=A0A8H5CW80_9AGAR|nr:hypothetical protein D9756_009350 [Leucoagaricus leucothites]
MAPTKHPVPPVIHRVLFRAALLSALIGLVSEIGDLIWASANGTFKGEFFGYTMFPLVVLVIFTARAWLIRYWLTIFELLWSMGEIAGLVLVFYYMNQDLKALDSSILEFMTTYVMYTSSLISIGLLSVISLFFVGWKIHIDRGRRMLKSYDNLASGTTCTGWTIIFSDDEFFFRKLVYRVKLAFVLISLLEEFFPLIDAAQTGSVGEAFVGYALFPLLVLLVCLAGVWLIRLWSLNLDVYQVYGIYLGDLKSLKSGDSVFNTDVNTYPVYGVCICAIGLLCAISLLSAIRDIIVHPSSHLFKPYYRVDGNSCPVTGWSLIIGNDLFKRRFSNDNSVIRRLRGLSAIILLFFISLAAIWLILVKPLGDFWATETKSMWVDFWYADLEPLFREFSVVVPSDIPLISFLNVSYIQLSDSLSIKARKQSLRDGDSVIFDDCTPNVQTAGNGSVFILSCPFDYNYIRRRDSVDISFDFSQAFPYSDLSPTDPGYPQDLPLEVYLGFTRTAYDIYMSTPPLYVLPGTSFNAFGDLRIREILSNRQLAAFGVPWKYDRFPIVHSISWIPSSERSPRNSSIASFSVTFNTRSVNGLGRRERDTYLLSVVDGFASIGGIWTFVNGVFACVFGSTLLLIAFERKPLSAHGLIHTLRGGGELHLDPADQLPSDVREKVVDLLHKHLLDTGDSSATDAPHVVEERADLETQSLLGDHPLLPVPVAIHNSVSEPEQVPEQLK